jgi:RNA recognition motif-containing protein
MRPRAKLSYFMVILFVFLNRQLEKVATHSGITRQHESSSSPSPNTPGRLISNRVFVGNIPPNLVERDLIMLFHRFGKIRDVKIIPEHTRNKSYGFVTFFSEADARRAIQVIAIS